MSKEGYLQTKINEQKEQIDLLKEKVEFLDEFMKNNVVSEKVLEEFYESHRKEQMKVVVETKSLIEPIFLDLFQKYIKKEIKKHHGYMNAQVKSLIDSNKIIYQKFCDEVVLQRKDLGLIINFLLSKEIITREELNYMDKKICKSMDESNMKKQIFDMFFPLIIKQEKRYRR